MHTFFTPLRPVLTSALQNYIICYAIFVF